MKKSDIVINTLGWQGKVMNKQEKRRNGKIVGRGIQWTDYTHNPVGGCKHRSV